MQYDFAVYQVSILGMQTHAVFCLLWQLTLADFDGALRQDPKK